MSDRGGEKDAERKKKGKVCGGTEVGQEDIRWVAGGGVEKLGGRKEDLMNVDHCPST